MHSDEEVEHITRSKLIYTAQVEKEDSNEKKSKSNAILLTAGDSDTDADVRLATQLIEHLESKLLITAPNTLTII